ncbi:SusD/RagB family nutrient-binding outer membrane lipoprotein [Jiulongibacter sp. NS-SX5]|uniref:SusD/RagB family nutrient-binding outer membrane lipoprotein n=1 Tax=Jiulongibacter sp. NS-SX5 TaxID=3463854 RepID=UPI004058659A
MKKLSIVLTLFLIVWASSCTNDFEEINLNPVAPVDVQPELLLRKVLFDYSDQMSYEGFVAGNLLGQLFTAIDFNLFDRHGLTQSQYGGNPWEFLYENLRDNEILLSKAQENEAFGVYEGPALVLKSLLTAQLTDLYGDVPYSEALQGKNGIVSPKYDSQQAIYTGADGILANLKSAVEKMEAYNSAIALQGDIIYSGDLSKWVKLANSLRFKYLMRISETGDFSAELLSLYQSGDLILNASDDAFYQFTTAQPNNFRMSTARIGDFGLFIMSETIEEVLTNLNDPRVGRYFRPTGGNAEVYNGLLNGPDASQLSISVNDYSLTGTVFREDAGLMKANFMSSFEMNFLLAEAAEKGWIQADAKTLYEKGIQDAFAYWYTDLPEGYLNSDGVAYGTEPIKQIITQKWLANIVNGYEGWIEWRRTGYPELKTISASLNDDLLPVRLPYPASESALNPENYSQAAANTSNNSINAPVWWDAQ